MKQSNVCDYFNEIVKYFYTATQVNFWIHSWFYLDECMSKIKVVHDVTPKSSVIKHLCRVRNECMENTS